jgi:hypothetical protein
MYHPSSEISKPVTKILYKEALKIIKYPAGKRKLLKNMQKSTIAGPQDSKANPACDL